MKILTYNYFFTHQIPTLFGVEKKYNLLLPILLFWFSGNQENALARKKEIGEFKRILYFVLQTCQCCRTFTT